MSDRNVAFEKGAGIAHSFNCTPPRLSDMRLADALVYYYRQTQHEYICVLTDINSALCVFLPFCSVTDISATVAPISMKVCVAVDLSSGHKVSPLGVTKCETKKGRGSRFLGL